MWPTGDFGMAFMGVLGSIVCTTVYTHNDERTLGSR